MPQVPCFTSDWLRWKTLARCWAGDVAGCFVGAMAKSQMNSRGLAGAVHGIWGAQRTPAHVREQRSAQLLLRVCRTVYYGLCCLPLAAHNMGAGTVLRNVVPSWSNKAKSSDDADQCLARFVTVVGTKIDVDVVGNRERSMYVSQGASQNSNEYLSHAGILI